MRRKNNLMQFILAADESRILVIYCQQQGMSKLQAVEELVERELDQLTHNNGVLKRTPIMNKVARYPHAPNAINNEHAFETTPRLEQLRESIRNRWSRGEGKAPPKMPETVIQALLCSALRRLRAEGKIRL